MNDPMARVEAALEQLGAEHRPPPGWDTHVLTVIGQPPWYPWWRRWRWWIAIPMVALTAIVCLLPIGLAGTERSSGDFALVLERKPVGPTMRGNAAHIGDLVHVTATSRDRYHAIWVYHNDRELLVACPAEPSCRSTRHTTTANVTLNAIGPYTFLAVASDQPLPASQGSFDSDQAAAEEAGAKTKTEHLEVQ
ncbi:MAG TPA: hypothetical protein VHN14_06350 [Kofleriaceae bacterium]|jgi:hypothetical protein|nr:hypothetical protein [Kofleriaceae bacterium]